MEQTAIAVIIVLLAAGWLAWQGYRFLRGVRRGGSSGCGWHAGGCGRCGHGPDRVQSRSGVRDERAQPIEIGLTRRRPGETQADRDR